MLPPCHAMCTSCQGAIWFRLLRRHHRRHRRWLLCLNQLQPLCQLSSTMIPLPLKREQRKMPYGTCRSEHIWIKRSFPSSSMACQNLSNNGKFNSSAHFFCWRSHFTCRRTPQAGRSNQVALELLIRKQSKRPPCQAAEGSTKSQVIFVHRIAQHRLEFCAHKDLSKNRKFPRIDALPLHTSSQR